MLQAAVQAQFGPLTCVAPYFLYADGSQVITSRLGMKFHPVIVYLPHEKVTDSRTQVAWRIIGWIVVLDAAAVKHLTRDQLESDRY